MITFARFIDEARKFPHLNPKVSVNQAIADHLASAPIISGTRIKNSFTSFTTIDKLGINPRSKYNTPIGIYAYHNPYVIAVIKTTRPASNLPFAGESPFANIFSVKGNIVHLNTMSSTEANNYYTKMISYYLSTLNIRRSGTEWKTEVNKIEEFINNASNVARVPHLVGGQFWYVSMKIKDLLAERTNRKAHIIWNSLFRGIGIDGFIDTGDGIIHTAEPAQAVFFSIDAIVKNKQIDNKYSPNTVKYRVDYGLRMVDHVKELQALVSDDERKEYVMDNPEAYKFLKNPSKDFERSFYNERGIEHIKNPSEDIQLVAVTRNGYSIRYIKNPSEKVQIAAVNEYGRAIKFIKNPSEKVQLAAVTRSGHAIDFIKNPSEKVQEAAINNKPSAIGYISYPSEKVQLAAVNKSPHLIKNIKNPTPKVTALAKSLGVSV